VVWWIAVGLVAFSLMVLALAAGAVVSRLAALRTVIRGLQRRMAEAQVLAPRMAALQERTTQMQRELDTLSDRAALLQAKRGQRGDG
jgi:hypothetical protein